MPDRSLQILMLYLKTNILAKKNLILATLTDMSGLLKKKRTLIFDIDNTVILDRQMRLLTIQFERSFKLL